jgi:SagB-type dehydrogenase family enzyme
MWALRTVVLLVGTVLVVACGPSGDEPEGGEQPATPAVGLLPEPASPTSGSLEEAIATRRSIRELEPRALTEAQVGQLLWAAQGITDDAGRRAAPSAGATYPLEVYAVTAEGVGRYVPSAHALEVHLPDDRRPTLADTSFDQEWIGDAALLVVITTVEARTEQRYADRAPGYVLIEVGHAAQNVLLQATALGLAATPVAAFDADALASALDLPDEHVPVYVLPVGHPLT